MKSNIPIYLVFFISIVADNLCISQSNISSPYSAFGLGNIESINNVRNQSMGGMSIGTRDYFTINTGNPASYTAFDSTSFVFEAGVAGHMTTLKTTDLTEKISSASMSHLLFGFPITKWWRSSFGLLPYSEVGYNVNETDNNPVTGKTKYNYEGSGGISRAFWGNAFSLAKSLSIGINASYLFGTIDKNQKITFPDSANIMNVLINNALSINNFDVEIGVQYYRKIKDKLSFVAGATYHPRLNLNARRNFMVRSFLNEINGVEIFRDTAFIETDRKGTVILPAAFGAGFSIANSYNWLFGIDYKFNQWSDFSSFGSTDSLADSHTISGGGAFIPDRNSFSYLKRVEYRLGANYSKSFLKFKNEDINGFGITFGVGLPLKGASLRRSMSMINIGVELGQRGTLNQGLIKENYFNVFLGVSIYEWWFFKRRYN